MQLARFSNKSYCVASALALHCYFSDLSRVGVMVFWTQLHYIGAFNTITIPAS